MARAANKTIEMANGCGNDYSIRQSVGFGVSTIPKQFTGDNYWNSPSFRRAIYFRYSTRVFSLDGPFKLRNRNSNTDIVPPHSASIRLNSISSYQLTPHNCSSPNECKNVCAENNRRSLENWIFVYKICYDVSRKGKALTWLRLPH